MKGDFSRLRFEPTRHYSAVLQQQGRVQLDADANEQRAIDAQARSIAAIDTIGQTGAPMANAGFAIVVTGGGSSVQIGAGRYYIDGLVCANEAPLDFTAQTGLVGVRPSIADLLGDLKAGRASALQVWLEAWERLATPLDDAALREVALGDADTSVRVQTVWRVVVEAAPPVRAGIDRPTLIAKLQDLNQQLAGVRLLRTSDALRPAEAQTATLVAQLQAPNTLADSDIASSLERLRGTAQSALRGNPSISATAQPVIDQVGSLATALPGLDCCRLMRLTSVIRADAPLAGTLRAQTVAVTDQGACLPSASATYRGLENQLYRVEIQTGGAPGQASFKWSRENGSVATRVTAVAGTVVAVESLGPDENLGYAVGDWVELSDDRDVFGVPPEQAGTLLRIADIDAAHRRITLSGPAPSLNLAWHPVLRRWDQTTGATAAGVPIVPGTWQALENGIEVLFGADGSLVSGDHWLIAARTAIGDIEWPPVDSDGAADQPPHRISIHRTGIACIHYNAAIDQYPVEDCRQLFSPLTALTPPVVPPAFHVTAMNWTNDEVMPGDQLLLHGLTMTLDQAPAAGTVIDPRNVVVTLELPATAKQEEVDVTHSYDPCGRSITVLDGAVSLNGATLTWSVPQAIQDYVGTLITTSFAGSSVLIRGRLRIAGRSVVQSVNGVSTYLDGEVFGVPAKRADGSPRIDLGLPSGNGHKASDFESWFALSPLQKIFSFLLSPPTTVTPQTFTATGTIGLTYTPAVDTTIALQLASVPPGVTLTNMPASIVVAKGTSQQTFTFTVVATGVFLINNVLPLEIIASMTAPTGYVSSLPAVIFLQGTIPVPAAVPTKP